MVHSETNPESTEVIDNAEAVIDLTDTSDKINIPKLVEEVMQVLSQSKVAEYTVYLKLCSKYGTGNGIS